LPKIVVRGPTGLPVAYRFDKDTITVGRSPANDLVIRDTAVSRLHVKLHTVDAAWVVEDRGSRNGTHLNGISLRGSHPLCPGDEIKLGSTVLLFERDVTGAQSERAAARTGLPTLSERGSGVGAEEPLIVGRSRAVQEMLATVERVAPTMATVLITGENGTGKELIARLIHSRSTRGSQPFVVVNCPALPGTLLEAELFGVEKGVATGVDPRVGRLELAGGGTLLLDEIGDLGLEAQAKILRFLQEKTVDRVGGREAVPVDVRLLAATNHDLEADIAAGTFRRDLYHRLNTIHLHLPPLRRHRDDIELLVELFFSRAGRPDLRLDPEALQALTRHDFPGNIRELENLVEGVAILADGPVIGLADLPEPFREATAAGDGAAGLEGDPGALYERIVWQGESFWGVIQEPYLKRALSREQARAFVAYALEESGGTFKDLARLFRIEDSYKKFVNFLRNHDLK